MKEHEISAAEAFALLDPQADNSRKALRLLLKEAALRGYVSCKRGRRKLSFHTAFISAPILAIIGLAIVQHPGVFFLGLIAGSALGFLLPRFTYESDELLLIKPTQAGLEALKKSNTQTGLIQDLIKNISTCQNPRHDNCSFDELLKHIKLETPTAEEYLDKKILASLVRKGYLTIKPGKFHEKDEKLKNKKEEIAKAARKYGHESGTTQIRRDEYRHVRDTPLHQYTPTTKGLTAQHEIRESLKKGLSMPALLRESPQAAGALAFSLGAYMLLVPDLEGRFGEIMHYMNLQVSDGPWEPYKEQPSYDGSTDGGGSSDWSQERDENDGISDFEGNDSGDWGGNSDYLDGHMDGLDGGFDGGGSDGGGCGGGDGSGCSGCSGGGCGGCGGGCS